jgi:hypothetical protein
MRGVAVASSKVEEYRRLARESFEAANRIQSEEDRKILLHIAEVWQHFAEQEEGEGSASDLPDIPTAQPAAEQPAAQQQQQVQPNDDDKKE